MNPRAGLIAAWTIARRRLRADRGSLAVFASVVLVTMTLAAVLPRMADAALDDAARRSVGAAPAVTRDLEFTRTDSLPPGTTDPLAAVDAAGTELQDALPASVGRLIADRADIVDSVEFVVADPVVAITQVRFRIQTGLEDRLRYVEGRAPAATAERMPLPGRTDVTGAPYVADVYEIAISSETAASVLVEVGDELLLTPDEDDLIVQRYGTFSGRGYVVARVVGRFDVVDPEDPYWFDDPGLRQPFREPISINLSIFHVTAAVHPGMYGRLVGAGAATDPGSIAFPLRYAWRYRIDPDRLEAGSLGALAADVTRLQARYPFSGGNTAGAPPSLRWGLHELLERHAAQQRASSVTLTLAALGPVGTALGALALVALVTVRRRETGIALLRSRGATTAQLLVPQVLESVLIVSPLVLVATGIGLLVRPGPGANETALRAVAVGAAAVGVVVAATVPAIRGGGAATAMRAGRRAAAAEGTARRRLVLDGTVVTLAVIAVAALRSRGLGAMAGSGSVDPLLAAVPVLVALAAGLVLVRVYPWPLRGVAALAARGRGLLPTVALWGAARQGPSATMPLLVVLMATAIGAFSSVVLASVQQGQVAASWRAIGADWRIDADAGLAVPSGLDPGAIPGIDAATGETEVDATIRSEVVRRQRTVVVGLDPATFGEATRSSTAPLTLPADFHRPAWGPTTGTDADPIPVLLSTDLAERARLGVGGTAAMTISGIEAAFRVVGTQSAIPGRAGTATFIVAPLGALAQAFEGVDLSPTSILVRGGPTLGPALQDAVEPYGDLVHIESRDEAFRDLHETPLVAIVQSGMVVALIVAVGYAALGLVAGLTIVLASRRRDLNVLRTLGLSRRGLGWTLLLEQIPVVLVAMIGGSLLGVGLAVLVGPSLGLGALADDLPSLPIVVEPSTTLAIGVLPVAIGVFAALVAGWLLRRTDLARAVRFNEG